MTLVFAAVAVLVAVLVLLLAGPDFGFSGTVLVLIAAAYAGVVVGILVSWYRRRAR